MIYISVDTLPAPVLELILPRDHRVLHESQRRVQVPRLHHASGIARRQHLPVVLPRLVVQVLELRNPENLLALFQNIHPVDERERRAVLSEQRDPDDPRELRAVHVGE